MGGQVSTVKTAIQQFHPGNVTDNQIYSWLNASESGNKDKLIQVLKYRLDTKYKDDNTTNLLMDYLMEEEKPKTTSEMLNEFKKDDIEWYNILTESILGILLGLMFIYLTYKLWVNSSRKRQKRRTYSEEEIDYQAVFNSPYTCTNLDALNKIETDIKVQKEQKVNFSSLKTLKGKARQLLPGKINVKDKNHDQPKAEITATNELKTNIFFKKCLLPCLKLHKQVPCSETNAQQEEQDQGQITQPHSKNDISAPKKLQNKIRLPSLKSLKLKGLNKQLPSQDNENDDKIPDMSKSHHHENADEPKEELNAKNKEKFQEIEINSVLEDDKKGRAEPKPSFLTISETYYWVFPTIFTYFTYFVYIFLFVAVFSTFSLSVCL